MVKSTSVLSTMRHSGFMTDDNAEVDKISLKRPDNQARINRRMTTLCRPVAANKEIEASEEPGARARRRQMVARAALRVAVRDVECACAACI
jgi:hypothetical protein